MTSTSHRCRSTAALVAAGLLALGGAACDSSPVVAPGQDAALDGAEGDAGLPDAALPDATVEDATEQQDAPHIELAWLAREARGAFPAGKPCLDLAAVLNRNMNGDPPEGRLTWLLRIEELSDTEARLTWGLGELVGEGGTTEPYRFRTDPPPTVVSAQRAMEEGNPEPTIVYTTAAVDVPLEFPLYPGGADPPSLLRLLAGYYLRISYSPTSWLPWPLVYPEDARISQEDACHIWVDGINLLDTLDGDPTLGAGPTGSVDFDTCSCNCTPDRTWLSNLQFVTFTAVNLLVD